MAPGKFFKWIKNVAKKAGGAIKTGFNKVKDFINNGGAQKVLNGVTKAAEIAGQVVNTLPSDNKYVQGMQSGLQKINGYIDKGQSGLATAQRVMGAIPNL